MPRSVSAREALTARVSIFAFTICGVSIPACVRERLAPVAAPPGIPCIATAKTSTAPSTPKPLEDRCIPVISHLIPVPALSTNHQSRVTSHESLLLLLQNLHQIIVALF